MLTLESVLDDKNISKAIKRVMKNKGASGVDKMRTDELAVFWERYGENICDSIYKGIYTPQPLLRMYITKKGKKKKRMLSIPTVLDRMLQQAILQKLSKKYKKEFNSNSFGYRKGKRTIDALNMCLNYMNEGYIHIVDIDIECFFDNVNHEILLAILRKKDIDEGLIELINKYLKNKVFYGGKIEIVTKGVSQGGPLSPLLANILLNELDVYITECSLQHVRYADDILIMTDSKEKATETMANIRQFLQEKLMLNLNDEKSQIVDADKLEYMGYAFKKNDLGKYVLCINEKISNKAMERMEEHINSDREDIVDWWNRIGAFNRGWINYYKYADSKELITTTRQLEQKCNRLLDEKLRNMCINKDINMTDIVFTILDSKQFVSIVEWYEYLQKKEGRLEYECR